MDPRSPHLIAPKKPPTSPSSNSATPGFFSKVGETVYNYTVGWVSSVPKIEPQHLEAFFARYSNLSEDEIEIIDVFVSGVSQVKTTKFIYHKPQLSPKIEAAYQALSVFSKENALGIYLSILMTANEDPPPDLQEKSLLELIRLIKIKQPKWDVVPLKRNESYKDSISEAKRVGDIFSEESKKERLAKKSYEKIYTDLEYSGSFIQKDADTLQEAIADLNNSIRSKYPNLKSYQCFMTAKARAEECQINSSDAIKVSTKYNCLNYTKDFHTTICDIDRELKRKITMDVKIEEWNARLERALTEARHFEKQNIRKMERLKNGNMEEEQQFKYGKLLVENLQDTLHEQRLRNYWSTSAARTTFFAKGASQVSIGNQSYRVAHGIAAFASVLNHFYLENSTLSGIKELLKTIKRIAKERHDLNSSHCFSLFGTKRKNPVRHLYGKLQTLDVDNLTEDMADQFKFDNAIQGVRPIERSSSLAL